MSSYHFSKIVRTSFDDVYLRQSKLSNDIIFACSLLVRPRGLCPRPSEFVQKRFSAHCSNNSFLQRLSNNRVFRFPSEWTVSASPPDPC